MVPATLPLADPSPIEELPTELLECILLEVAKHVVPPVTEDKDSGFVVYRYAQEEEQACSLAFRLTSRRFRNCSWKAFGAYLGETIFDLRSRQSISNLTAASTCEHLAPWVTKLIIACAEAPPGYPFDQRAYTMRMEQAEWDQLRQDSYSDLHQIKLAEDSWYPGIWKKQKGYGSPMTGSGIAMSIIQEAGTRALQDVLAQALFCFKNMDYIGFYHQPRTRPGRYHNLFQKFRNISPYREEEVMRNAGDVAHLGLRILIHAMVASKITVRTMTLAVDLDEHHAFITNIPSAIFAKASQKVETLVLRDMYCPYYESPSYGKKGRLSITRSLFPRLRSLVVDHSEHSEFIHPRPTIPLPSPSDTPALDKLTVRNTKMNAENLHSFLQCYGQQARCISFESPANREYCSALESVRNLHVETLEIEHHYGGECYWKSINIKEAVDESEDPELLYLEEFPENLAKTVKLHPPSFKVALERYWLKHPEEQSGGDE